MKKKTMRRIEDTVALAHKHNWECVPVFTIHLEELLAENIRLRERMERMQFNVQRLLKQKQKAEDLLEMSDA